MEALATVCVVVLHGWCAGGLFSVFSFKRAEVRGMALVETGNRVTIRVAVGTGKDGSVTKPPQKAPLMLTRSSPRILSRF